MLWIFLSLLASFLWGSANVILKPVQGVAPYIILMFVYMVGLLATLVFMSTQKNVQEQWEMLKDKWIILYLVGNGIALVGAGFNFAWQNAFD